jgi:HD superfamily phosphodiesterase
MHYCKARIVEALIHYFETDYRRIDHALSVLKHAERIAESKTGWDYSVLIASALLHDIGIKPAEKLHGYNNGTLQEQFGPPEAQRLLSAMEFPEAKTEKVMQIIGNHHSRSRYDYIELEILKQADAIVNKAEESEMKTSG